MNGDEAGSVRRSRRQRSCDECAEVIDIHSEYFAVQDDGLHDGWSYYCLDCATTLGWIAPVLS